MRSMTRLAELGYIEARRRRAADGGNASCEYRLLEPVVQAELFADTPPVTSTSPPPVTPASPPPESCSDSTPESCGDSTVYLTTPLERKNTAEDARAISPRPRRHSASDGQRALLLPIDGGCRSASEPDAVPVTLAGDPRARPEGPPLKAVPSAGPDVSAKAMMAGAVPPDQPAPPRAAPPPDAVPSGGRKVELDRLEAALRAAAGGSLHVVSTALMVLSDPLRWLDQGCDIERDVLPALRAVAERSRPGAVRTWGYFSEAVFEARDRRLAPPPSSREPPTDEGRHGTAESPTRAALRRIRNNG